MNQTLKNIILAPMNILYRLSPKTELMIMFYMKHGYKLSLNDPKTYSEKINWMKLYYRDNLMPKCADKYTVRQYVRDCGCGELLNDLLWEGFDAREIPFNKLPQQFVIKVTHGSGNNIICKNKSELDINKTIRRLNKWLKQKYLPCYGEWFYGVINPRIIVEEFLSEDNVNVPVDYKMFCFNNIGSGHGVGFTDVVTGRFVHRQETFYDAEWNILPKVSFDDADDPDNPVAAKNKPELYEKMLEYAIILSKPFPHARIDFFQVNNRLYVGEITFMNGAGFDKILPFSFDQKMGSWIKIPTNQVEKEILVNEV